ncbi:MAG TPA: YkgJ family cysteine cluster protein [Methanothermococcus okinawensis]|nr:YkgJ family cysteine cluster protein [Methanothermococcus okinawensis]
MVNIKIDTKNIAWICRKCGRCCYDPPTVTKKDIGNICGYLKIAFKEFVKRYVDHFNGTVGELRRIKKKCIFLKDNKCSIYPVRPLICRLRPYSIQEIDGQLVLTYDSWFLEKCPGLFVGDIPVEEEYIRYGLLVAKYLGIERRTPKDAFKSIRYKKI